MKKFIFVCLSLMFFFCACAKVSYKPDTRSIDIPVEEAGQDYDGSESLK